MRGPLIRLMNILGKPRQEKEAGMETDDLTGALNRTGPTALDVLLSRRSVKAREMCGSGPSKAQLTNILKAGARVKVKEADIFDYILVKPDGSMEGNETSKLIEKQAGPKKKK